MHKCTAVANPTSVKKIPIPRFASSTRPTASFGCVVGLTGVAVVVAPRTVASVVVGTAGLASELLEAPEPPVGQGRSRSEVNASKLLKPVTVTTAVALHPPEIVVCGRPVTLTTFLPWSTSGMMCLGVGKYHVLVKVSVTSAAARVARPTRVKK